jgi:hypothetical protein
MDEMTTAVLLSLLAGVIAGSASIITWVKTAHALRAKHRLNNLLKTEALRDSDVSAILAEISSLERLSDAEMERVVSMIERKISILPEEDQSLIEEGLRQGSREGVSRYLREVAA